LADLPYIGTTITGPSGNDSNDFELRVGKGAPNGYAPLDANAIVPPANLPERVKADWNSNSGDAQILNRPNVNTSASDGTGGFVDLHGGTDTEWSTAGNAGSIDLSGGDGSTTEATANQDGGNGGSLLLSGESLTGADGGTIDCRGLNGFSGGYINTSGGGGSIDTRGAGAIQLGVTGTRTTLNGSASGTDKTINLPNISGTLPIALIGNVFSMSTANIGTIAAGSYVDVNTYLNGVSVNDPVFITCLSNRLSNGNTARLIFEAFASDTNQVTVRVHNPSTSSISSSATINVRVVSIKTS